MLTRIPAAPAFGRALRLGLLVTFAAVPFASLQAAEAAPGAPLPVPGGPYMQIHMDNQKAGSPLARYWQAQAAAARPAAAPEKPLWQLQTDSAYLTVYAYYCAPAYDDRVAMAVEPSGLEVALYTSRFRAEYGGDCRAFYLGEVAPRIDPPTAQAVARP